MQSDLSSILKLEGVILDSIYAEVEGYLSLFTEDQEWISIQMEYFRADAYEDNILVSFDKPLGPFIEHSNKILDFAAKTKLIYTRFTAAELAIIRRKS